MCIRDRFKPINLFILNRFFPCEMLDVINPPAKGLPGFRVLLLNEIILTGQRNVRNDIDLGVAGNLIPVSYTHLSRFRTSGQQKKILGDLALGKLDMIIGTHRLLSQDCLLYTSELYHSYLLR